MTTTEITPLDAALIYAARGWHVFPCWWGEAGLCACPRGNCDSPAKHPLGELAPHGLTDATTDPDTIRRWWGRYPEANVGIRTGAVSGLVALDVDPRHGGDDSLALLHDSLPDGLPECPIALTGGGGRHLLFAHPGIPVPNKVAVAPGLDVRGDGGYIVAAPSVHVSGGVYAWELTADPADLAPPPLPELLRVKLIADGRREGPATDDGRVLRAHNAIDIGAVLKGVPEGGRNSAIFRMAAKCRRVDMPYAWARRAVLDAAAAADPPLDAREALRALDSAYRYAPSEVLDTEETDPETGEPATRPRFRLLTAEELKHRPRPEFAIDGILVENSIAVLSGAYETFKSVIALDMGLCRATGRAWQGRAVRQGPVVYVSAEGSAGLGKRIEAWERARGERAPGCFYVLPEAVQLIDAAELTAFQSVLLELPEKPSLLILDTLARCFVGGEENSAKEMGVFVEAAERLRRAFGCIVLIIHHHNKGGKMRGSVALPGGVETIMQTTRDPKATYAVLECEKQKEFDHFENITLTMRPVELGDGDTSIVLDASQSVIAAATRSEQMTGTILRESFGETGATYTEWRRRCEAVGISTSSFKIAKKRLIEAGKVRASEQGNTTRFYDSSVGPVGSIEGQLTFTGGKGQGPAPPIGGWPTDPRRPQVQIEQVCCPECGRPLGPAGWCGPCKTRPCRRCGASTGYQLRVLCMRCAVEGE